MRFRKSIKAGGVRFNISKSGIGASIGTKGLRLGYSPSKGTYTSYNILGTGIYDVKYHNKSENKIGIEKNEMLSNISYFSRGIPEDFKYKFQLHGCLWCLIIMFFFPFGIIALVCIYLTENSSYKNSNRYKAFLLYNDVLKDIQNKEYKSAREKLSQIMELYPDNITLKRDYTECCILDNDYDAAIENLKTYADDINGYLKIMNLSYKIDDYKSVIKYGQKLPDSLKEQTDVITMLGYSYYQLEKYELALEILLQGPVRKRKIDEEIAKYRYVLGLTYEKLGKNNDAIKQYQKILVYDEDFMDVSEKLDKLPE